METLFRADLIGWLRSDPALAARLNAIEEESPVAASPPWLGIAASGSTDWSHKSGTGREVRVALELQGRGEQAASLAESVAAIEQRIGTLAPDQGGYRIVSTRFLRSRAERRPRGLRAVLLEYRFTLLQTPE